MNLVRAAAIEPRAETRGDAPRASSRGKEEEFGTALALAALAHAGAARPIVQETGTARQEGAVAVPEPAPGNGEAAPPSASGAMRPPAVPARGTAESLARLLAAMTAVEIGPAKIAPSAKARAGAEANVAREGDAGRGAVPPDEGEEEAAPQVLRVLEAARGVAEQAARMAEERARVASPAAGSASRAPHLLAGDAPRSATSADAPAVTSGSRDAAGARPRAQTRPAAAPREERARSAASAASAPPRPEPGVLASLPGHDLAPGGARPAGPTFAEAVGPEARAAAAPIAPNPAPRSGDRVTLQFQGENGVEGHLRVALRGGTLHATIQSPDAVTASRLEQQIGDLRRALADRGFSDVRLTVQHGAGADAGAATRDGSRDHGRGEQAPPRQRRDPLDDRRSRQDPRQPRKER